VAEAAALVQTARGAYRLTLVDKAGPGGGPWTLTVAVEHTGGMEKFGLRCHIAGDLVQKSAIVDHAAACLRLASWLEGQFEQVREAALKSVRSERRLAEFAFDQERPGPF
jgi:hypothetical protein